jgi:hypothetical protein
VKIWIQITKGSNYKNIKLHCEEHSSYEYLGDLNDAELRDFLTQQKSDIDVDKNINLLKYFGYLHLFIINKN